MADNRSPVHVHVLNPCAVVLLASRGKDSKCAPGGQTRTCELRCISEISVLLPASYLFAGEFKCELNIPLSWPLFSTLLSHLD